MGRRIITTYEKLNQAIKKAIDVDSPFGIEQRLTQMKHLIKGYFFVGFEYKFEDTIYLIEWDRINPSSSSDFLRDEFNDDDTIDEIDFDDPDE